MRSLIAPSTCFPWQEAGMNRPRVLFVCAKTGMRAQIAAEFLRREAGDQAEIAAASFGEVRVAPLVRTVAAEFGVSLTPDGCKSVFRRRADHEKYDYVVVMCSGRGGELCPIFRANVDTLYRQSASLIHWDIPDLQDASGEQIRAAIQLIQENVRSFVLTISRAQPVASP